MADPQEVEKIKQEAIEKTKKEMNDEFAKKEEDIKKMKSDMGLEGGNENDAAIGLLSDNTQVKILKI